MIITAMTTKYRDLAYLLNFGIQLMMYTTTVIYPLSSLKGKLYWIVALNPMTFIIEGIKASTLGTGIITLNSFLYVLTVSIIIFSMSKITSYLINKLLTDKNLY